MHQQSSETVMVRYLEAQTGHKLAIAALFACLTAAPALAQSIPLPTPRPAINAHPTGSIAAPARPAVPSAALGARAQALQTQAPNPVSNPFAALLGRSTSTAALSPEQRGIIERVNNYLSTMQILSGKFVQVGPDGRRTQGTFYTVSYTHLRAHETRHDLVCRLLLEKKKNKNESSIRSRN